MSALRLATVALVLLSTSLLSPTANAQIVTSGVGVCHRCGHADLDTQRYVNSFLNQMFFPYSASRRASIAASLYLFTATYTMYGKLSPDPGFASVAIAITAEVKNAVPTGMYRVTVTTPSGTTTTTNYAIGKELFSVMHDYAEGAIEGRGTKRPVPGNKGSSGPGSYGRSGPSRNGGTGAGPGSGGRPAKCSRSRREDRGNETIVWCSES